YRSQYKVPSLSKKDSTPEGVSINQVNRARRTWFRQNSMEELAPRLLEEFLISGVAVVKISGSRIMPVTPDNFFFRSNGYDPRGADVDLIGEVHNVSYANLISKFCHDAADIRKIHNIYGNSGVASHSCRLIEVWSLKSNVVGFIHDQEEAKLNVLKMENLFSGMHDRTSLEDVGCLVSQYWQREWFACDGTLLRKDKPAENHPYVFKAYPFLDGEVHSYISDIIDQQRYVNRLITLYDFIMKSSAKGVLLFPDESLPSGIDLQDVADEWSRFNGVISYRARPGIPMPTQVSGNATNIGITDLLKIELQMLEDISGVSPTLQGKLVTNATSGTLFARQNEAAQTSLLDVIRTFTDFLSAIATRTP
ncbi:MAG: hypothetical protein K2G13_09655, partial [Muribaculaceae bacterium]|nr:hypothetical protein [Muribaculaceae bacterium]